LINLHKILDTTEIYYFNTVDIEQKLYAIENTLTVLNYAIQGLKEDHTEADLDSFETVIMDARQRVNQVCDSMQPISLDWQPERFMVIVGCEAG
jgi:hypothetical protein